VVVSKWLEVFTLEELLEYFDLTPEEVLCILIEHGYIEAKKMPLLLTEVYDEQAMVVIESNGSDASEA